MCGYWQPSTPTKKGEESHYQRSPSHLGITLAPQLPQKHNFCGVIDGKSFRQEIRIQTKLRVQKVKASQTNNVINKQKLHSGATSQQKPPIIGSTHHNDWPHTPKFHTTSNQDQIRHDDRCVQLLISWMAPSEFKRPQRSVSPAAVSNKKKQLGALN